MKSMKPKSAALLKSKLQKWKAEAGDVAEMLQIGGGDTDNDSQIEPDNELEPAQLMAGPASASSLAKTVNVNLGDLLANFRDGKPKVQLKTEAIKISAREADQETEELRSRLRRERRDGKGAIRLLPPGISWLADRSADINRKLLDLSSLPVNITESVTARDQSMLELLRKEIPTLHLVRNINMNINLITNKHLFLTNIFYAMCLHVRRSVVESTQKCLLTILSHSYKLVNESLDTWVPGVKDIQKIIASYGGGDHHSEVGATPEDENYKDERNYNISHPRLANLKAMTSVISASCSYRRMYTDTETIDLMVMLAKLSLDKDLICTSLTPDLRSCIHTLIAVPNEIMFANIEPALCERLLYLVSHHHNKLHLTSLLPAMSERSNNLRQFLAYLTISQLISGNDISLDQDTEWSISSLTHEFFRLDLSDSGDMYYLYSVMSLFDVVVGSSVDCSERDDLEAMRAELSKQCRIWKETPLRPDITKTKNLMHRISLRWQYLVQQATAVDVVLDIKYKPTPTKIIPVCSQEVREEEEEDEELDERVYHMDTEKPTDLQSDSAEEEEESATPPVCDQSRDKGKRPMNPNKSPILKKSTISPKINLPGLEKLRNVARDFVARSSSQSPNSSRATTPNKPCTSPESKSQSLTNTLSNIKIGNPARAGLVDGLMPLRQAASDSSWEEAEKISPSAVCKALDFVEEDETLSEYGGDESEGEHLPDDNELMSDDAVNDDDLPDLD